MRSVQDDKKREEEAKKLQRIKNKKKGKLYGVEEKVRVRLKEK